MNAPNPAPPTVPPGAFHRAASLLQSPHRLVAAMLWIAALLAFTMALTEGINDRPELWRGPPDEHGHRSAARYYVDHWLPPKVGDAASLDSYSRDYGYSYINDPDLVYFFAGKFAALISPVVANHELGFRLFNVTILALLALVCTRRPAAWPVFVPLLLSPQIWYVFSYFNGDALPLFLAVLLAYQVASPESAFNRYLDSPGVLRRLGGALLFGVLVGVLALSKKNYFTFLAFLPVVFALGRLGVATALLAGVAAIVAAAYYLQWFALSREGLYILAAVAAAAVLAAIFAGRPTRRARAHTLAKAGVLAALALAVVLPRFAWDAAIHGSLQQKLLAQSELQEKIAKPEYKPSQVYQGKNPQATYYGLDLRKRGTPLRELFGPYWSWHTKTYATATGSYGWTQFNSPKPYGVLILGGYLAIFGLYAWAVARSKDPVAVGSFALVAAFSALTLAIAVFQSWNNDFQAQGRYLFPILAMLGIGLMHARRWLPAAPMMGVVGACFLLSVYSFVFIGLVQVQKHF